MSMIIRRSALLLAASRFVLSAAAAQAQQAESPEQVELREATAGTQNHGDIVVTGTRASLENAERVKRDAVVVIDGISADDISALPDDSIADSLIRITGLTANDDVRGPDAISVRGLSPDLVGTTINGRTLATASGGDRRISLAELPTEGISGAYVQKTQDAATIEGGVAGTLNLVTIHPLETSKTGLTLVGRLLSQDVAADLRKAPYNARLGERAEATYVGRLGNNLGVALSYAYLRQDTAFAGDQIDNWRLGAGVRSDVNGDGVPDALPTNAGITTNFNDDTRHSLLGMVQWDANSHIRVSLDGMYVRDQLFKGPTRFFANNIYNGPLGPVDSATVVDNSAVGFAGRVALYRELLNATKIVDQTYGGGLNVAIKDGPIKAKLDIGYSEAKRHQDAPQATIETDGDKVADQRRGFDYDIADHNDITIDFADTAPEDYALSHYQDILTNVTDRILSTRGDFEYAPEGDGLLKSVQLGFRIDQRDHGTAQDATDYDFSSLSARPDLDSSYLLSATNPLAARSSDFGGPGSVDFPYFDFYKVAALANSRGVIVSDDFYTDQAATFHVRENGAALYTQLNFAHGPVSGNAGLRYVSTDEKVTGPLATSPTDIAQQHFNNTYNYLLPSANLRYDFTDKLLGRLGFSKSISRQQFNDLQISSAIDLSTVTGDVVSIKQGNPDLKPFAANNFDLSLEWYPSRAMAISVAAYYKKLRNYLVTQTENSTVTLPDGTVLPAIIQTTINDPHETDLRGIEASFRRDFDFLPGPLKNLGFAVNANYNQSNVKQTVASVKSPDPAVDSTVAVDPDLFSKIVVNAQLYYSSKAVDLRFAYRYYDPYIRAFFNSYQAQPSGQLDVSGGVTLTSNFRLIGSVRNLLGAGMWRRVPDYRDLSNNNLAQLSVYQGRVYTLGIRAHF